MKLFHKIIITVLVPLAVMSVLAYWQMQQIIDSLELNVRNSYVQDSEAASRKLSGIYSHFKYAAGILASSEDVVKALELSDNDYLVERGALFMDDMIRRVTFADINGIVVARAPDEFSFADSIANKFYFRAAVDHGSYYGVAMFEGVESIVYAAPVRKYGEYKVGYVAVSVPVDRNLLDILNRDISGLLEYSSENMAILTAMRGAEVIREIDLGSVSETNQVGGVRFSLKGLKAGSYADMQALKYRVAAETVLTILVVSVLLFLLVKYHLKPYGLLLDCMSGFRDRNKNIKLLRANLEKIETEDKHELHNVIENLKEMASFTDESMDILEEKNRELRLVSRTDTLTQLNNRTYLDSVLMKQQEKSVKNDSSFSLIMSDIDNLKKINDKWGNQIGDSVLKEFSALLKGNARSDDIVGRWNGGEFMIICPETDEKRALFIAEKIHAIMNSAEICGMKVTACFGIGMYREGETVQELVRRTDEALRRAKKANKNCIRRAEGSDFMLI